MGVEIKNCSIFDIKAESYVNTVNCVGVMGTGIAQQFKSKYPSMFDVYKSECELGKIKPGNCNTYYSDKHKHYIFNLSVKRDWKEWSTLEWVESAVRHLKLEIIERDIKSIALPLIGGKNGRRGPLGLPIGYTALPTNESLKTWLNNEMSRLTNKFPDLSVYICIPEKLNEENLTNKLAEKFFQLN